MKGETKMRFYDIESEEIITIEQLETEYNECRKSQPNEYNYSFTEYVKNCMTANNGTLELIK